MNTILDSLPEKSRDIIQNFFLTFKNKIAEDIVNYEKVTEEIKKTAQKGVETRLQLHQIDKETEKAATGIIEKSELIMERQNEITDFAKKLKANSKKEEDNLIPKFETLLLNILEASKIVKGMDIEKSLREKIKTVERELIIMTADKLVSHEVLSDIISRLEINANENLDDLFEILNLCQFQDITSQELAKAHSLIKTIIDRLNYVLNAFNIEGLEVKDDIKIRAFDANASFSSRAHEQQEIDELFQAKGDLFAPSKAQAAAPAPKPAPAPIAKPQPLPAKPAPVVKKSVPPLPVAKSPASNRETVAPDDLDFFERIKAEMESSPPVSKPTISPPVSEPKKTVKATKEPEVIAPDDMDFFERLKAEMENQDSAEDESPEPDQQSMDVFEQLQSEMRNITVDSSADEEETISLSDDVFASLKNFEVQSFDVDESEEELNPLEIEVETSAANPEKSKNNGFAQIDIDELTRKFENAGSGEIISQEEIDRILSGG